jgi:hypothetical protein
VPARPPPPAAPEGVPLNIIQRQVGHTNLGTTSIYIQGIDPDQIITAVRTRRAPMMSASVGLRLSSTATNPVERERYDASARPWRSECLDGARRDDPASSTAGASE